MIANFSDPDKTLLFQPTKYLCYDKFFDDIFGHDGTNNYMNQI